MLLQTMALLIEVAIRPFLDCVTANRLVFSLADEFADILYFQVTNGPVLERLRILCERYSALISNDPTLLSIGGNTNGVDTFVGLDVGELIGGVISGHNLLQRQLCVLLSL
ncbi:hypothetical protein GJ744_000207 [Endocarpon pusillum]|uniref:Uncharacterized protein n=1 Tax=Endocarpon pusillum TaxID=364733 RepID=A0A8H7E9Q5_9EURO|nr:hypothetical protein GJ744_000207 [Endocarpon pusillum]